MHVAIASHKGGVGKTTTAVHVAGYLQQLAPTVLYDGDPIHNAIKWKERGEGFPFHIADMRLAVKLGGKYEHSVVDSGQRPSDEDLKHMAESCDLLIIPAVPLSLDTDGLILTIQALQKMNVKHYRVLVTKAPPEPQKDAQRLLDTLKELDVPVFATTIPYLKAFSKATSAGLLVSDVDDPRADRAWDAYQQVGKEMFSHALTS